MPNPINEQTEQTVANTPAEAAAAPPSSGTLKISVTSTLGYLPIPGATVTVSFTGNPETVLQNLVTDESGQTETFSIETPNVSLSLSPDQAQPYAEVNIQVDAPDYEPTLVSGAQILPGELALQTVRMKPLFLPDASDQEDVIVIPAHTLYGEYPAKIPEDELKPLPDTGEVVLSRVVIPEYVIVHDGVPSDSTAKNYYVRYKDYIKNVASCEIYSTWPEAAIYANILAIMSFTLNRVFSEWYRNHYQFPLFFHYIPAR